MKKSRHKNKKVFNFSFSYKHNGGNGAEEYEDLEWAEGRVKKKNLTNKFLSKTPFFLSNLCCVYHSIRARQSDQKKPQNLETAREKKQQRAETFLWSKKRDASLSEF